MTAGDRNPDPVPFAKLNGLGNDYIYLDEVETRVDDPSHWARVLSDRHRGVGGDGIIILREDGSYPCRMEMYNADGSRAEMCGNGIRCVAALAHARGYATSPTFEILTDDGPRSVHIKERTDVLTEVRVDMGVVQVDGHALEIEVGSRRFEGVPAKVGNPHLVIEIEEELADFPVAEFGPPIERHDAFPDRTNVEFVRVTGPGEVDMRVWERGSGETRACGTGATAAAAVLHARGHVAKEVTVHLLGGSLRIEIDSEGRAFMTGPAEESFTGTFRRALIEGG